MSRIEAERVNTLLLTNVCASLDTHCELLSLIIEVGRPPAAKKLFNTQTCDDEEQPGTTPYGSTSK